MYRHHNYTGGNLYGPMVIYFMLFCPLPDKTPIGSPSNEPSQEHEMKPRITDAQLDAMLDACPTQIV